MYTRMISLKGNSFVCGICGKKAVDIGGACRFTVLEESLLSL